MVEPIDGEDCWQSLGQAKPDWLVEFEERQARRKAG